MGAPPGLGRAGGNMSRALGHILAELGLATRDLSALSPVQSLHHTALQGGTGSCTSPWKMAWQQSPVLLPFPLPHHAMRYCRGKQPCRAITIFKSPSSSFMTVAVTS